MNIKDQVLNTNEKQVITFQFSEVDNILKGKHGEKWIEYRRVWNDSKNMDKISNIPLYILLELNSFCNLRCKMCKHADDEYNSERYSMDMEIFNKIIHECKQLQIPSINIGSGTECTLHPEFKEIIKNTKHSGAIDKFFLTNGSTLSDYMITDIFEGEFERVEISVDAATEETYLKIRKNGNYNRLEKNIQHLINEKLKRNSPLPIIRLSFCVQEDNIDEINLFYKKWENKVDIIDFQKMSVIPGNLTEEPKVGLCTQPFNRLTIDYNGDIFPCCSILYQERYCLGNIRDMSIDEAWNCERMQQLRRSFQKNQLMPHCKECLVSVFG